MKTLMSIWECSEFNIRETKVLLQLTSPSLQLLTIMYANMYFLTPFGLKSYYMYQGVQNVFLY